MSRIYTYPINYRYGRNAFSVDSLGVRTGAPEVKDNNYETFSTETEFILETHGDTRSENTRIDHAFIKSENVTSVTIAVPSGKGSGTGITNSVIPTTGIVNGIQHTLISFGPLNATEVQIDISGVNTKVYELMAMRTLVSIPDLWQVINPSKGDRGGRIKRYITGNTRRTQGVEERMKWQVNYQGFFYTVPHVALANLIIRTFDENPNFTWVQDFTRFPDRVYPATLQGDINITYVGRNPNQRQISFTVLES